MGDDRSKSALLDTAEQFHILVDSVEEYAIYLLDPNGNVMMRWPPQPVNAVPRSIKAGKS